MRLQSRSRYGCVGFRLLATVATLPVGVISGCSGDPAASPPSTLGGAPASTSTPGSGGASAASSTGAGGTTTTGTASTTGGGTTTTTGVPSGGTTTTTGVPSGGTTTTTGVPSGGTPSTGGTSSGTTVSPAAGAGGRSSAGGTSSTGGLSQAGGQTAAKGGASSVGGSAAAGGTSSKGGSTSLGGTSSVGGTTAVDPAVTKTGESLVSTEGYTASAYGGYLNGESFQQEGILTFNGYQYVAYWNTAKHVVVARRQLPTGTWATVELTDYTTTSTDDHNTISMGISPGDGTLHLSFDHHGNDLHYRKSVAALASNPTTASWVAGSFGAATSALVGTTLITPVTYPRFIVEPGGTKMLFGARLGASGAGDEHLWEYSTSTRTWAYLGKYLDGITDSVNAYPHGLSYTKGGSRLHITWCWRATPDASTNQDLMYMYSDDHGRTWKDNAGTTIATTGSTAVRITTASAKVWTIPQNRGLINQEHMAVDPAGRVHVLLGHMPDSQANDATFTSARTKSQYFHYVRSTSGTWARNSIAALPVVLNYRGKLAISSTNNVYAILPNLRIAAASPSDNFTTWKPLLTDTSRAYYSDPLIDASRLETSDNLTVYYPLKAVSAKSTLWTLDYTLK